MNESDFKSYEQTQNTHFTCMKSLLFYVDAKFSRDEVLCIQISVYMKAKAPTS